VTRPARDHFLVFGCSLTPLLFWWFVLLPGNFTIDSVEVVNQVRSGTWNDWHTNSYTFFAWSASLGGRVWSFITLAQVLLLATGVASMGRAFRHLGVSTKVAAVSCLIFSALPQVGSFAVTMWKDVPSTAGAMMLAAALVEWWKHKSTTKGPVGLASVGAILLACFRWNGPVALMILALIILMVHRKSAARMASVLGLVAVASLATLTLPQRAGLTESSAWFNFEVRELHDLAYVYHSEPAVIQASELPILKSVMPLSAWAAGGSSCEGVEVLQYESFARYAPASFEAARERRVELRDLWRDVLLRAPLRIAIVRLCRAGGVLSPVFFGQQPTLGLWYHNATDSELVRASYLPPAESALLALVRVTSTSEGSKTLFLNAMLWTLIALIFAVRAKSQIPGIGGMFAVGSSIMISVALGANAHDARYVAGALLIAQFFVLIRCVHYVHGLRRRNITARA